MKAEPYDISRLAALIINFILARGTGVEDAIQALQVAERMLRDAYNDECGRNETDPNPPPLH